MIERVSRKIKQRNSYMINLIGRENLTTLLSNAPALHCLNPLQVESDWINDFNLTKGNFDITNVNKEYCQTIPTCTQIGKVYARLISSVTDDYATGIMDVYNSYIATKIDDYNCSAYYEPSYVITRAYLNGSF